MRSDIERWDSKYAARSDITNVVPDETLVGLGCHLGAAGWAMDLAAGLGADSVFLAGLGYRVIALDCSYVGLSLARRSAADPSISYVVADAERFVWRPEKFALISVVRFLNRGLLDDIKRSVQPGGLVFYKTFNQNHLRVAPNFCADYVLRQGELADWLGDWRTLASNDTSANEETFSYILAQKPDVSEVPVN